MKSNIEISPILNVLMRFSMSQDGLDASSAELQKLFKKLQPTERYEHRTVVVINAGLKCLDQRDWLQIKRGELKSEIFHLLHEAENEKDEQTRNALLVATLAKVKVLGHSQLLSSELHQRASEYLLHANAHILSNFTKLRSASGTAPTADTITGKEDPADASSNIMLEEAMAEQLEASSNIVAKLSKDLSAIHDSATGIARYISQSNQSFEAQVHSKALAGIVAFSKEAAERAISLCDIASNSFHHFGNRQPADALTSKQWLIAYSLTAATIIGACRAMVTDALLAFQP